jgi:hypothetical protein
VRARARSTGGPALAEQAAQAAGRRPRAAWSTGLCRANCTVHDQTVSYSACTGTPRRAATLAGEGRGTAHREAVHHVQAPQQRRRAVGLREDGDLHARAWCRRRPLERPLCPAALQRTYLAIQREQLPVHILGRLQHTHCGVCHSALSHPAGHTAHQVSAGVQSPGPHASFLRQRLSQRVLVDSRRSLTWMAAAEGFLAVLCIHRRPR